MMDATRLRELIAEGEGPRLEFKRDDVHPESLAREMSALLNHQGGYILLGVEDDGTVTGLTRGAREAEEWVMNVADGNVDPRVVPAWDVVELEGKQVGVTGFAPDGPFKPYRARSGSHLVIYVRVGSTSRVASLNEERRLHQASGNLAYDELPVPETSLDDLDMPRLRNYLTVVLGREAPRIQDFGEWTRLLSNLDFLRPYGGNDVASVAGLLLFGKNPARRLRQAGISAWAFPGLDKNYDAVDEDEIRGPLVSTSSPEDGTPVLKGVIEHAVDFVMRNVGQTAWLEGAMRVRYKHIPIQAVREAIVNAVAHRDYTHTGVDIEVSVYPDRLEVISPGTLPNGLTVEKIVEGRRVSRNKLLTDVLRDYGYIERLGQGVRLRLVESMRLHNGTVPEFIEQDDRFIVRLFKGDVKEFKTGVSSRSQD